ncbi:MAG TPA: GTP 3',8-cyclase MoaA [Abditibacteriaceae bacterium]|jgi:cyclic pyranopterin phosphate synthase
MLCDRHNRVITYLRISVTDRCNFRCTYCLPEDGIEWLPRESILTFEEIARVATVGASLGLKKIRLTGGEPTLRRDLPTLVQMLRAIDGVEEIALTTNASRLDELAQPLHDAGLSSVNISLDSLQSERANALARRDVFADVQRGIEAAVRSGLKLKFNAVVSRGVNDDELCDLVHFAHERGAPMRFIEMMPMGDTAAHQREALVSTEEMRATLQRDFELQPEAPEDGAARGWKCTKTEARVAFISSMSEAFCDTCNRMRLTAEGGLRPCLHQNAEVDVRALLRNNARDDELQNAFRQAADLKWAGHHMTDVIPLHSIKNMISIGG